MAKTLFTLYLLIFINLTPHILLTSLACGDGCHHHPPKHHCPKCKSPPHVRPPTYRPPPVTPSPIPPVTPTPAPYRPPPTAPTTPATGRCPVDALKLGLCLDVLSGLIHVGIGGGAREVCCPLIQGLASLDAALCLCTVIRARLLNLNIMLPLAISLLIDCGKYVPADYTCPPLP